MLSISVGDLLTDVAEELEVIDSGGGLSSLTPSEQTSMIKRLARLLDSAGGAKATVFGERLDTVTLTAQKQTYTIGFDPTGTNTADLPIPRPTKIERSNLFLSATVRRPVAIYDESQWAAIRYQTVYGPPRGVYFDKGFGAGFVGSGTLTTAGTAVTGLTGTAFSAQLQGQPITINGIDYPVIKVSGGTTLTLGVSAGVQVGVAWSAGNLSGMGKLRFYLIPDQNYVWEFYSWQQLPTVSATGDLMNYPPIYADYFLYSMVIRCGPMFGRKTPSEIHVELLRKATADITAANCPSPLMNTDELYTGGHEGLYNWLDGQTE